MDQNLNKVDKIGIKLKSQNWTQNGSKWKKRPKWTKMDKND